MTTPLTYTKQELKLAQAIVDDHLFNFLLHAPENCSIRLGSLGKITKKLARSRMNWTEEKQEYIYYRLSFTPFSKLKATLNNQITQNYG